MAATLLPRAARLGQYLLNPGVPSKQCKQLLSCGCYSAVDELLGKLHSTSRLRLPLVMEDPTQAQLERTLAKVQQFKSAPESCPIPPPTHAASIDLNQAQSHWKSLAIASNLSQHHLNELGLELVVVPESSVPGPLEIVVVPGRSKPAQTEAERRRSEASAAFEQAREAALQMQEAKLAARRAAKYAADLQAAQQQLAVTSVQEEADGEALTIKAATEMCVAGACANAVNLPAWLWL